VPEEERESRTEPATPRRRQEARERGQVARSADLSSALMLLMGLLFVRFYGPVLLGDMKSLAVQIIGWMGVPNQEGGEAYAYAWVLAAGMLRMVAPLMLFLVAIGLAVNWVQFGFVFSGHPLVPNLNKINPVNGLGRIFSARGLVILANSMLKVLAGAVIVWLRMRWEVRRMLLMPALEPHGVLSSMAGMAFRTGLELAIVLLALSVLDFLFHRYQYERDLRMTPQEVKEELKRMEGDPIMRARRRAIMRRMVMQQMMRRVPEAEVVITNPTHLAVALHYEPDEMLAPEVVAKGQRLVAERIKQIAREHAVPIVENRPLARALFKAVDVGQQVPAHLYEAVAEVLALVWGLNERSRSGAA
jgi:flagellar biosynthetic protein FlhB